MATKADIRQRVAEEMGRVAVGQSPEAQEAARIDATYDEVYQRLVEEGLATWASTAEVPTKVVPYYCLMMEEKLLLAFSVPDTRYVRVKTDAGDDGSKALAKIAELVFPEYDSVDNEKGY